MSDAPLEITRDSVGRRGARADTASRRLDAQKILIALLVFGFVLRVFIAGVYLPQSGFRIDVGDFAAWAQRIASVGPAGFYESGYFSDYPPGYLYVLWLLGSIGSALAPLLGTDITPGLVKVPAILADVGIAGLLFAFCRRFAGSLLNRVPVSREAAERLGLIAAAVYLLNPGVIFNASVWGQIDSVGALLLLGTIYLLARGRTELAAAVAVVALVVKFQFAFLVPIVAIVGLRRHLAGRSSDPELDGRPDPRRVLTSLAAGFATLVAMILPFGMWIWGPADDPGSSLVGKLSEAAGTYTGLSINAFNLWRNPWSGLGDTLVWGDDTTAVATLGSLAVTWQLVGTVLFAAVALAALWQVARRDDAFGILLAALVVAIAFFVLPTRVHERYLFPALALAAPLVLRSVGWSVLFAALSLSFFANVYWTYTADWSFAAPPVLNPGFDGEPLARNPLLAGTLFTNGGIYLLSAMAVVALAWVAWRSLAVARAPAVSLVGAELLPEPPQPPRVERPYSAPAAEPPNRWSDRFAWLRPDPKDPYLREGPRRLDRRDAALLTGLVLFALVFRLWRLDTPRSMHFDEVYHARSATEWLADWEHGWQRDVYEWTHPMLAKYLIAGGIVLADPNRVVDVTDLEQPAPALAVAPRRSSQGYERSIVFSADGGTQIVARDVASDEVIARWQAGGPIASLAYDEEVPRLLVGLASGGIVETYDLAIFLGSSGERGPPPKGIDVVTDLAAVNEIVIPMGQSLLLLRGQNGIATAERQTGVPLASAEMEAGGIGYLAGRAADGDAEALPERVVVSDVRGGQLLLLDATTLAPRPDGDGVFDIDAPLLGPLMVRGRGDDSQVFALTGALPAADDRPAVEGGVAVINGDDEKLVDVAPLPGRPRLIGWQQVANLVYVAGTAPDGEEVVWTVEPHGEQRRESSAGFAPFDTTALPGAPLAMAFDISTHAQGDDAGRLLVSTAGPDAAQLVTIDAGSNAFAWRLAGVIFGALLVGLIYLLAATMFARRRIAVLAATFVALDGMSYVMSRIAMNDIFVAVFITAAYLLFWQIWSGRWSRSAWWALPAVGILIGLAAATKWVGFYALAGMVVLVLSRSALGRLVLVAAVAFAAIVAGFGAPWPFTLVIIAALGLALLIVYHRPIRLDSGDLLALPATGAVIGGIGLAFAVAYPTVDGRQPGGAVELVFSFLTRGAQAGWPGWLLLAVGGVLLLMRAVRSLARPESDRGWYLPGGLGGFAWPWIGACLVIVPLAIYVLTYVPYLQLGHAFAIPETGPGYHWSLDELHSQMFGYHFGLQAGHVSASPWWSWPLDLKPTWFFSADYDGKQLAVIYNGGNPILFWSGIPAVLVCGILAWKRRSHALVLLTVAFAFQYLPWTRIERATFQYHYLTAVIFAMVAVAYLTDELLRRPALREFGVAFLAAAAVAGLLVFPLGAALPMPDWYINAARSLPPWNYGFIFPDPLQGKRGDLLSVDVAKLSIGLLAAAAATVFALRGRAWPDRRDNEREDDGLIEAAPDPG